MEGFLPGSEASRRKNYGLFHKFPRVKYKTQKKGRKEGIAVVTIAMPFLKHSRTKDEYFVIIGSRRQYAVIAGPHSFFR
jgi:hypothetical protein